jgi:hypothetical protein
MAAAGKSAFCVQALNNSAAKIVVMRMILQVFDIFDSKFIYMNK